MMRRQGSFPCQHIALCHIDWKAGTLHEILVLEKCVAPRPTLHEVFRLACQKRSLTAAASNGAESIGSETTFLERRDVNDGGGAVVEHHLDLHRVRGAVVGDADPAGKINTMFSWCILWEKTGQFFIGSGVASRITIIQRAWSLWETTTEGKIRVAEGRHRQVAISRLGASRPLSHLFVARRRGRLPLGLLAVAGNDDVQEEQGRYREREGRAGGGKN